MSFITVDWSVEWKNQEVPVIVKGTRHRRYPATKYSPEEPAYWEITGFDLPDGMDHLEGFVWDQIELYQEELYDQLSCRLQSWLDSLLPPVRERW